MYAKIITIAALILLAIVIWLIIHQKTLKQRAYLMKEAILNRDFTFRLSSKGLLPGEKAMQQSLNELGEAFMAERNRNEMKSWERLIRVLTHEIMNATTPITSISQAMLKRDDVKDSALEDGIRAINAAGNHLNTFVDSYRKLSQLQAPVLKSTFLSEFITETTSLYPEIKWETTCNCNDTIFTDPIMLKQVFINIIKNALEANAGRMAIDIEEAEGTDNNQLINIYISNNGTPIPADSLSTIFVPFFTTKRSGSGIGLSLCQQIMTRLNGDIMLCDSPKNSYTTTFKLSMPYSCKIIRKHYN